jgi:hypothetical protein
MVTVPATRDRPAADAVSQLIRKVSEYFDAATERPKNAVALVRYFVHVRHQLTQAAYHLRSANEDVQEQLMRQAEIAFLTRPGRFATVNGRADLIRAWTTLLVEADQKLEADARKTERYARMADAADEADNDSAVMTASRTTVKRWHDDP